MPKAPNAAAATAAGPMWNRPAEFAVLATLIAHPEAKAQINGIMPVDFRGFLRPIARAVFEIIEAGELPDAGPIVDRITETEAELYAAHGGAAVVVADMMPHSNLIAVAVNAAAMIEANTNRRIAESTQATVPIDPEAFRRCTDIGNSERFVDMHHHFARYCGPLGGWMLWDSARWKIDETGEALQLMVETVRTIDAEAEQCEDKDTAKAFTAWERRSEGVSRLEAGLHIAKTNRAIAVHSGLWDTDPMVLNCKNGTVDLITGKLYKHRQGDHLTKLAPYDYPEEDIPPCPQWMDFLNDIMCGDLEMVDFLQRAIGYSLTGLTDEQCLFFLHGGGANGKSTLINVMERLLGDYSRHLNPEVLAVAKYAQSGPSPDLARLRGARFVGTVETEKGRAMAEGLVKQMTGKDTLSVRFLHAQPFEFVPCFKMWFAANDEPAIRGQDDGIWRRIRKIPFDWQVPPEKKVPNLDDLLLATEGSAILRWAVDGAVLWKGRSLDPPAKVLAATEAYRQEQDTLLPFLDACCIVDPQEEDTSTNLYKAYKQWAEDNGARPLSAQFLGRRLAERKFQKRKSNGRVIWVGLRSLEQDEPKQGGFGYQHPGEA